MGYQESWVYIEPQWNFKNLIRAYEQAEAAGYYKLFGAEPLSVIILKRSFGKKAVMGVRRPLFPQCFGNIWTKP